MIHLDATTVKRLRLMQRIEKDKRVYIKVTVLLMLHQGLTPLTIAESLGIDDSTVYRYRLAYEEMGLEDYLKTFFVAYSGRLTVEQEQQLEAELRERLYINTKEVAAYIKDVFGIRYSLSAVARLLGRLGFVYKKTKGVGLKADREAQEQFLEELQGILAQSSDDQVVYFNDAVHPQHNTRPDYGWIYRGEDFEMPSNPGRKRININGALNATNVTDVLVVEADRINAQSCTKLWKKQRRRHPGKTIINICDNAPYYHSKYLKEWLAENPWCKVIYLPPYAPNLNLIERLWKFLRKKVTSYDFYEHFADFRQAILDFFKNIKEHKQALESLLTLNFHIVGL
ncbi:MAG: IS630 family transposase [Saprospiraceae bacterium]